MRSQIAIMSTLRVIPLTAGILMLIKPTDVFEVGQLILSILLIIIGIVAYIYLGKQLSNEDS